MRLSIHRTLVFFLLVLLVYNLYEYISLVGEVFSSRFLVDWAEGSMLANSWYIQHGFWPLHFGEPPYLTLFYPPLIVSFVSLFHSVSQMLLVGRMMSLVSYILMFPLVYLICKRLGAPTLVCLLCSASLLLSTADRTWSVTFRVDMPALFFSLLGIYLFLRYESSRWYLIACIPLVVSIWMKQTAFTAGLAILIYLLFRGRYKDAVIFSSCCIFLASIPLVIGVHFLGTDFIGSFTSQDSAPVEMPQAYGLLIFFLASSFGFILVGLLGLKEIDRRGPSLVIGLYFVASFAVTSICITKQGSYTNYYVEIVTICCLLLGIAWVETKEKVHWVLLGLLVSQGIISVIYLQSYNWKDFPQKGMREIQENICKRIEGDQYVLSDDASILLESGKGPVYGYFLESSNPLYNEKMDRDLTEDIRMGKFDHIVLFTGNPWEYRGDWTSMTEGMRKAIIKNYRIEVYYLSENSNRPYKYVLLRRRDA